MLSVMADRLLGMDRTVICRHYRQAVGAAQPYNGTAADAIASGPWLTAVQGQSTLISHRA